jgi:hypothetical protein
MKTCSAGLGLLQGDRQTDRHENANVWFFQNKSLRRRQNPKKLTEMIDYNYNYLLKRLKKKATDTMGIMLQTGRSLVRYPMK